MGDGGCWPEQECLAVHQSKALPAEERSAVVSIAGSTISINVAECWV